MRWMFAILPILFLVSPRADAMIIIKVREVEGVMEMKRTAEGPSFLVNSAKIAKRLRNSGIKKAGALGNADEARLAKALGPLSVQVGTDTLTVAELGDDAPLEMARMLIAGAAGKQGDLDAAKVRAIVEHGGTKAP